MNTKMYVKDTLKNLFSFLTLDDNDTLTPTITAAYQKELSLNDEADTQRYFGMVALQKNSIYATSDVTHLSI
jgi:hypothetical protein